METRPSAVQTLLLTGLTLIAFAANSLLTRMALGEGAIDASSFTTIRLGSGAVILLLLAALTRQKSASPSNHWGQGNWTAALTLFVYAVAFSFSYLQLTTGTGALIMFGTVQVTMILAALRQGEKPSLLEWIGLLLALCGLVYLVLPGLEAPPLLGSGLMIIAGGAWGVYSLLGQGTTDPIAQTTRNFVRVVPFALGVSLVSLPNLQLSRTGVILALLSGALASGLGYSLWYAALRGLTATRAATVQLLVPVIASAGGVLFLQETLSSRLILASLMILGGIGLAVVGRTKI